jgi:hypothetical protein
MKRWALLLLAAGLAGCALPNKAIRGDYADYNETIHYTQSQQMLLNLVRLKYRELPLFLKVGALSASYSFEVSGGADLGKAGNTKLYGLDLGASFASRPTITYTPLEGDTFVKQVLSEVSPEGFVLLYRSGWPVSVLCHVMVERIGQALNRQGEPSYAMFQKLVDRLQAAQDADKLRFDTEEESTEVVLITDLVDIVGDERLAEERELRYPIHTVQMRSFLDIMFFLAKNTEVPPAHHDQVKESAPNGWMRIRSASTQPDDALVSVRYNGYWFSIARVDIPSKDTFSLVKLLYQMQAGDIPTVQPILTLPVAQP